MRALSLLAAGWVVIAGGSVASATQLYEGFWASAKKDCTDQDSANRLSIEGGNRLYWYETRFAPARSSRTATAPGRCGCHAKARG